jgi:hypothetical protein
MSESKVNAFLSGGGKITHCPMGHTSLDPITGMTKSKLKSYLKSRNSGARASPKSGRPRKDCKKSINNAILSEYI